MVSHQAVLSSVVSHKGGLSAGGLSPGGLSAMWSLSKIASHQCGFSSG